MIHVDNVVCWLLIVLLIVYGKGSSLRFACSMLGKRQNYILPNRGFHGDESYAMVESAKNHLQKTQVNRRRTPWANLPKRTSNILTWLLVFTADYLTNPFPQPAPTYSPKI